MPGQHSLYDVLDYVYERGRRFTFSFEDLGNLFLVSITYQDEHKTFLFFKARLDELFPGVDIPSVFRQLSRKDFTTWPREFLRGVLSWLYAGHLHPLSRDDDAAKHQVNDYLYLHDLAFHLNLPTVQNHIVDIIRARKTCHEGWYDALLVRCVYNVTRNGEGLRRFLVDSFVYKSYRQFKDDAVAKDYWSTHRRSVLAENMDAGNLEFVMDQADAAAQRILNPYTRNACHYHNHDHGSKCSPSLKRKREDSMDNFIVQ